MNNKLLLLILDGLGIHEQTYGNAVTPATMPHFFHRMSTSHVARLEASGEAVGLAADQVGNSEVGHATIGAGRVLKSKLAYIADEFQNGNWAANPWWQTLQQQPRVHIAGVLSDAGVHAHLDAMLQTIKVAIAHNIPAIYLHVFLDGVDAAAKSAPRLLAQLRQAIAGYPQVQIGVVMGRLWACDRSGLLAVTKVCVDALYGADTLPKFSDVGLAMHLADQGNERDFPAHVASDDSALRAGEHIILTNHRSDRTKQLCEVLLHRNEVYTLADLTALPKAKVFFPQERIQGGLLAQLSASGRRLEVVAEACKFKHVTYFLNGFKEIEDAIATEIPTIADQAIRLNPAMSIVAVEDAIGAALQREAEFVCANIANLDQVGHTGDLKLTEQAASYVDNCFERVVTQALTQGYMVAVTADHGNADVMLSATGEAQVSHSANPVPFFVLTPTNTPIPRLQPKGALPNIAPTLLALLGEPVPVFMHRDLLLN